MLQYINWGVALHGLPGVSATSVRASGEEGSCAFGPGQPLQGRLEKGTCVSAAIFLPGAEAGKSAQDCRTSLPTWPKGLAVHQGPASGVPETGFALREAVGGDADGEPSHSPVKFANIHEGSSDVPHL